MLGIGAGALGVAVAARVASAVVDTPVSLPNNEIDHETFLETMETPGPEIANQMIDLKEVDWDKWIEDMEQFELPAQDFRQESPPIVDEYQYRYNYVVHENDIDPETLQQFKTTPGNIIHVPNVETKDHALDAYRAWSTSNEWGRNE